MKLTTNDLTVSPEGFDRAMFLSSWKWAVDEPLFPVLLTAMGDVFAQGSSGQVYFIDTCAGLVEMVADDGEEFRTLLSNPDFVNRRLCPQGVGDLRSEGLVLGPGQCYSHKQPLCLGGRDALENVDMVDMSVHVDMMGQIHHKIKDRPPGTKIHDVKIK